MKNHFHHVPMKTTWMCLGWGEQLSFSHVYYLPLEFQRFYFWVHIIRVALEVLVGKIYQGPGYVCECVHVCVKNKTSSHKNFVSKHYLLLCTTSVFCYHSCFPVEAFHFIITTQLTFPLGEFYYTNVVNPQL